MPVLVKFRPRVRFGRKSHLRPSFQKVVLISQVATYLDTYPPALFPVLSCYLPCFHTTFKATKKKT